MTILSASILLLTIVLLIVDGWPHIAGTHEPDNEPDEVAVIEKLIDDLFESRKKTE